jgi:hypothetical protein
MKEDLKRLDIVVRIHKPQFVSESSRDSEGGGGGGGSDGHDSSGCEGGEASDGHGAVTVISPKVRSVKRSRQRGATTGSKQVRNQKKSK